MPVIHHATAAADRHRADKTYLVIWDMAETAL